MLTLYGRCPNCLRECGNEFEDDGDHMKGAVMDTDGKWVCGDCGTVLVLYI